MSRVELAEICRYRTESAPVDPQTYVSTESMLPNREGITTASSVPSAGKARIFRKGDTLVSNIRPYFKKIWQANADGCCSADVLVFKPSGCNGDYLYWLLSDEAFFDYMVATSKGTKMPRGDKAAIMHYEFERMDDGRQTAIAKALNPIRELININQQTNDYLLQLANLQIKNYLQLNEDIELVTVRDYTTSMSNGATPSRKNAAFWDGGTIPWVKTGEVNNDLILSTEEHITQLALDKTSVRLLPVNTVIMALYGSGTAGRLGILQTAATTNQACTAMVCESAVEAFYLFLTLQGMYRQIDNMTRGSVQQNLSKDMVAGLQIPRVPKQELIEMGLNQYYAQIAVNKLESSQLASMRDALLPKLMSGEIDVSEVEPPMPPNNHLYGC